MTRYLHTQSYPAAPAKTGKIYIWPTRYGILFSAVLLVMLLGSLNYNNNMGLLLTFLLTGIALVSLLRSQRALAGVSLSRLTCDAPFAGETLSVILDVNCTRPPSPALAVTVNGMTVAGRLPADDADEALGLSLPTVRRGRVPLDRVRLETVYPLGLFRAIRTFVFDGAHAVVYPSPIPGPLPFGEGGDDRGEGRSSAVNGTEDFSGHRAYQPGDPPKRIDWRAYSRGQGLFSKTFADPGAAERMLVWDRLPTGDPEYRLSLMCHAILTAHREGWRFGLRLPWVTVAPDAGASHMHACLRQLALTGYGTAP